MGRVLVLFFVLVFLSSCGDGTPQDIIAKKTMAPLLTDLHLADGYASHQYQDTATLKSSIVYKAMFEKYNTDSATIRKSLDYYTKRPDELVLIYQEVEKNLNILQKAEEARLEKIRQASFRKLQREKVIKTAKAKVASDRAKMLKGKYDFGLPSYRAPGSPYLKLYKNYPVKPVKKRSKTDSLQTDSRQRDLLKNKRRK